MTACLGRENNGCVEGYLSILKQDVSGCAMELVINEFVINECISTFGPKSQKAVSPSMDP